MDALHNDPKGLTAGFAPVGSQGHCKLRNISENERALSLAGGTALLVGAIFGPRRWRPMSLLSGAALLYRGVSGHCHGYEMLGINTASRGASGIAGVPAKAGVAIDRSIHIQRPVADLFQYWKELQNLPRVMTHLESVTPIDERTSHWVALGPFDYRVEWDAEVFHEGEDFIAWRSLPGGDIDTAGSVHFRSRGENQGTDLEVSLKYNPPGGKLAAKLAGLLGQGLEHKLEEDLWNFKRLMEETARPAV